MEVDNPETALALLQDKFPELTASRSGSNVEVSAAHQEIPGIVEELVHAGIKLYAVVTRTKTLEDTFLEMTGGHSIV